MTVIRVGAALAVAGLTLALARFRARTFTTPSSSTKHAKKQLAVTPAYASETGYCKTRPPETTGFILQQTMLRVKDPKKSLDFYSRVLGMRLVRSFEFPEAKFSLYFLGYVDESAMPADDTERKAWLFQQPATLELTHNHGTENQPDFKYISGNVEPHRGFGHIGVDVPDLHESCARFEKLGVKFIKKPNEGRMKNVCFIEDPDGYWIEIFSHNQMVV